MEVLYEVSDAFIFGHKAWLILIYTATDFTPLRGCSLSRPYCTLYPKQSTVMAWTLISVQGELTSNNFLRLVFKGNYQKQITFNYCLFRWRINSFNSNHSPWRMGNLLLPLPRTDMGSLLWQGICTEVTPGIYVLTETLKVLLPRSNWPAMVSNITLRAG